MRVETPEIYEHLLRQLITGALPSGEKLKPAALQGDYGCSANTVRDVLMQLSAVGLVQFEIQRGFRVTEVSRARMRDVTRFRVLLEQDGAAKSMQNGGVAWESRLTAAHHKLKHIESKLARGEMMDEYINLWSDAELEFHETLISACGSPILRETFASIYVQCRQQLVGLEPTFSSSHFTRIIGEHQTILDAALSRDISACKKAIAEHQDRHFQADALLSSVM